MLWLFIGAAYFLMPLIGTLLFSLKDNQTGKCCTLSNYSEILHDPAFWKDLRHSSVLSLETIVIALALLVPTVYWVHLKLPRAATLIGFLALVPFVMPPIILVVGLLDVYKGSPTWFYAQPYGFLVAAYVILAFPYIYFSLDAGFRAIDVHTLTEASQSLGASWPTTLVRVILPNIRVAAHGGRVPDARDRDGGVHDRFARDVRHVPDLPPVHQPEQGVSGRCGDAHRLRRSHGQRCSHCSWSAGTARVQLGGGAK